MSGCWRPLPTSPGVEGGSQHLASSILVLILDVKKRSWHDQTFLTMEKVPSSRLFVQPELVAQIKSHLSELPPKGVPQNPALQTFSCFDGGNLPALVVPKFLYLSDFHGRLNPCPYP